MDNYNKLIEYGYSEEELFFIDLNDVVCCFRYKHFGETGGLDESMNILDKVKILNFQEFIGFEDALNQLILMEEYFLENGMV